MAIDIYSKQRELQQKLQEQQERAQKNQESLNQRIAAFQQRGGPGYEYLDKAKSWDPVQTTDNEDFLSHVNKGVDIGAYRAEKAAARDEITKYKKLLEEEDQRVGMIKPLADLQGQQELRAKEFRTAFPSILDSKLGRARTQARRDIAEGVSNTRASHNQRGLLFSGMRAGAEAGIEGEAESRLADEALATQQELEEQANQLDQDVIDTGFQIGNISKDLASTNEEYRKSVIDMLLNKDQARQQAIGGLLGTGAQIAGYGLGAAIK